MMTVGLLAVVVYLYTVVAFNFFRKFYNMSEDEDEPDMKCDDMMTVSEGQRYGYRTVVLELNFTLVVIKHNFGHFSPAVLPVPHVRWRACWWWHRR